MAFPVPVRLGAAENTLIEQLNSLGATATAERITVAGLPTRRVEAYHYTDLKTLLRAVPPLATPANQVDVPALDIPGAFNLILVNGVAQQQGSVPAGLVVHTVAGGVLSTRDDILVHLNTALVKESLSLTVEPGLEQVIQIVHRLDGAAAHVADAVKIFVADGASATIVETFSSSDAAHVGNHASYVALGKGARLTHVTVDVTARSATHFATNEYHVGEEAKLRTLAIHAGVRSLASSPT